MNGKIIQKNLTTEYMITTIVKVHIEGEEKDLEFKIPITGTHQIGYDLPRKYVVLHTRDGKLHNETGAALDYTVYNKIRFSTKQWWLNGVQIIEPDNLVTKQDCLDKSYMWKHYPTCQYHRPLNGPLSDYDPKTGCGPAIVTNELRQWVYHGKLHRSHKFGPAVESIDGKIKKYVWDGKLHNPDGPAVIIGDSREWWKDGVQITDKEYHIIKNIEKDDIDDNIITYRDLHGKYHNPDGPALIRGGNAFWYSHGTPISCGKPDGGNYMMLCEYMKEKGLNNIEEISSLQQIISTPPMEKTNEDKITTENVKKNNEIIMKNNDSSSQPVEEMNKLSSPTNITDENNTTSDTSNKKEDKIVECCFCKKYELVNGISEIHGSKNLDSQSKLEYHHSSRCGETNDRELYRNLENGIMNHQNTITDKNQNTTNITSDIESQLCCDSNNITISDIDKLKIFKYYMNKLQESINEIDKKKSRSKITISERRYKRLVMFELHFDCLKDSLQIE